MDEALIAAVLIAGAIWLWRESGDRWRGRLAIPQSGIAGAPARAADANGDRLADPCTKP